jgi:serine/threonine protein kinase
MSQAGRLDAGSCVSGQGVVGRFAVTPYEVAWAVVPCSADEHMTTTMTKAGRYEILGELGRGAMGVVYKAMDPVIGRNVAVKTIKLNEAGTGLTREELLQRFQTEARAAGLLTHPNIVVVYDAGEEDGLYYITMELVEGKSLQALLDTQQIFPLSRVLRIMEQTCSALQFAHERNVVHRDIKPANLMLTGDDTVKITDFGTAKILQFGTVQQTAHVMGTPSYMSPEQVKGKAVDGRSDIFSLGVMLYEMVTGEKPFPGQNITTVIYKIVNEEPVPPRQVDPSVHPGINDVILKALAKDPDERYQSCREVLEDLRCYRSLGGNPDATMALGAPPLDVSHSSAGRSEDAMTAAHLLRPRAGPGSGSPNQTPAVRRTAAIPPMAAEAPKKSRVATFFLSLVLLGIIGFGGYRVRPFLQYLMAQRQAERVKASQPPVTSPAVAAENQGTGATEAISPPTHGAAETEDEGDKAVSVPIAARTVEKPAARKPEPAVSVLAEAFKVRLEQASQQKGIADRLKIQASGNSLTVAGKLHPREHSELLSFLRQAPAAVHVVDHIEYDDVPESLAGGPAPGDHPQPKPGYGAIHVVTDVIDATAALRAPRGRLLQTCQTPCSFNDLSPQQYSLEVRKDGYQPVQTALAVKSGSVLDQKIALESLAKGFYVTSQPPGADIFIDGAKQSGQTPLNLPLAGGQYNLVIRLEGYDPYVSRIQVKNNSQTPLNVELTPRASHIAWADVSSRPAGAEILLDGTSTGKFTPSRVSITAGTHAISLNLKGFEIASQKVFVDEGQSVRVDLPLKMK